MNWTVFWTVIGLSSCLAAAILLLEPSTFMKKLGGNMYLILVLFFGFLCFLSIIMGDLYYYGKL